jgi:tripartite-type tricarboxylate transporter receptor subunit TctC
MPSIRKVLLSALCLPLTTLAAGAQAWPSKPIKAVIPFAAGSVTDVVPRVVFEQLASQLGQSIVVENRPGAGGTIAANAVAKSDPDGYTLLANSSAHTIAPALYPNLGYSTVRDFAAVASLGILPSALVVPPSRGYRTVADFVQAAKGGTFSFASAGVGTATYLSAVRFEASTGVRAVHVPFKGGPEAMTEVMTGRIDFFFAPVGVALPHVKDGKLTALAVNSVKRSVALPDVPTTAEAGFANAEYPFWIGVFLPAKTPREVVERLHRETVKALQEPRVKAKLLSLGVEPMPMTATEFDNHVEKEVATNASLVKAAGIKAN